MRARRWIRDWGSTAAERAQPLPCDALLPRPDAVFHRAVDVDAPAATTFRWLCQLRAAPYSYDKLDNLGRRSPQTLTPGMEQLAVGQRINTIFRLEAFEPGRSLTMNTQSPVFGQVACTYLAEPAGAERSRILVRFAVRYPPRWSPVGLLLRAVLAPGDLLMMRRQLLNLKQLAQDVGYEAPQTVSP